MQQWNDQSGGGYNATQATSGNRPTYKTNIINGQPVLRFSGSPRNMATSSFFDSSFNTSFTFFIVTTKANTTIEVSTSNSGAKWYSGADSTLIANTSSLSPTQIVAPPSVNWTVGIPTIETFKYNGTNAIIRCNTFSKSVLTTGNLGLLGALTIGSLSSNSFYYHGDIAEIIIYNTVLDDTQVDQIESYLMTKYNITDGRSSTSIPLFVFDGDSMTYGVGSTGGQTYPYQTETLLGVTGTYTNSGVSGQQVSTMTTDALTQIDPDYSALRTTNIVTLLGGTNDLYFGASAATTYSRIVSYLQARRTAGFKVIVNTILPRSGGVTPGTFEADRQTVNGLIRSNWATFADGISDVASDTRIGDAGDESNITYYGDLVHLTNTGYGIVASYATAAIKQIMDPIAISDILATPSSTTADISWTTNQLGSTKINYGLDSFYGSSTTEIDISTRVLSHSDSLSGLTACTTYHFQTVSIDLNSNEVSSPDQTFSTNGCVLTSSAGANGSITASDTVDYGTDKTFDMTPALGYHIADVLVDSVSVGAVGTYDFTNVTATHTISVTFAIDTHTVTYTAGANGSITGTTPQTINYGADATTVTAVADSHYHFVNWSDGILTSNRTDANITSDLSVTANFAYTNSSSGSYLPGYGPNITNGVITNPVSNIIIPSSSSTSKIQKVIKDLKYGMINKDVKTLQLFLIAQDKGINAKALAKHGATNYFGKLTKASLAEWQKVNNIKPAVGYFGKITRAKIKLLNL